jgi:hypothetical protein
MACIIYAGKMQFDRENVYREKQRETFLVMKEQATILVLDEYKRHSCQTSQI